MHTTNLLLGLTVLALLSLTCAQTPSATVGNANGQQQASLLQQTKQPKGHQPSMEEALRELKKFPLDKDEAFYRQACNAAPHERTFCDPKFREFQRQDLDALLQATALGIDLKMPFVEEKSGGDYDVGDPFDVKSSGLPKQFAALKEQRDQQVADSAAGKASAAESAAAAKAKADADAAAQKAAADAAAEAAIKSGQDAAAAKAAADKAAADLKAKQDAEAAAAAKAKADAEAAAEAAKPRIKRVGQFLQAPNGRTLYFKTGESPSSISCTGPCRPFWPLADPTWRIDASAGCTGAGFVRTDGDQQLQCGGRPLYLFRDDTGPNQQNGLVNPDFKLA